MLKSRGKMGTGDVFVQHFGMIALTVVKAQNVI